MWLSVKGFYRPLHHVSSPRATAFNICFYMQNRSRLDTDRVTTAGSGCSDRERKEKENRETNGKMLSWSERCTLEMIMFKPTLRITKMGNNYPNIWYEWHMTTVQLKSIFPITPALSSITVGEEITKPLNNYFSNRFVSFVSVFFVKLKRSPFIMSVWRLLIVT